MTDKKFNLWVVTQLPLVKPQNVDISNTTSDFWNDIKNITENSENIILKKRLEDALSNREILENIITDYSIVFQNIWLNNEESLKLAIDITDIMKDNITLEKSEEKVLKIFNSINIDWKTFFESLKVKLKNRTNIIVPQLSPCLRWIEWKVIDYWAWSWLNAQWLNDELGLDIECIDIRDFKHPSVKLPIKILDENSKVPAIDNYYQAWYITNVLHHEKENEKILIELTRLISNRLIVIETVPNDDTKEEIERTFCNDVLWNRYFNYANIPVPWTFERPNSWIKRFEELWWKLKYQENLWYDQPTIRDIHHLFVFEK